MKATALLEKQHRKVETLMNAIETGHRTPKQIEELAMALTGHAMIEEEIFYPEVKKQKPDLVLESYEEHELVAFAVKRLAACDPTSEVFPARLKAVKELVTAHVQEEETELFPVVGPGLGEERQEALGKQMEERFKELSHLGYEGAATARKATRRTSASSRSQDASAGSKANSTTKKKASQPAARHA